MARYVEKFDFNGNQERLIERVNTFMESEGFKLVDYKGEEVFKKGHGLLSAPSYLKLEYYDDEVVIGAWLKYAVFPGVYIGELGIKGFIGALPKKMLKSRVKKIIEMIEPK